MKRILIVRLSAIGDVVMASPLIGAFHRTYPEAKISWLVEKGSKDVLLGNRDLDEVIVWPRDEWRRLFKGWHFIRLFKEASAFIRKLRKRPGYDLALDAQGLLKSGIWALLSGAKVKVGIGSKEGSRLLMTRVIDRSGASDRISSQYLLGAEVLGLDISDFSMCIPTGPEEDRFVDSVMNRAGIADKYAVFCPFTTRPQKHWIDERWGELAGRIGNEFGMPVLILGGPEHKEAARRIRGLAGKWLIDMAGETTIKQAAGIIKRSSLLVGVDTGLTHMGIAQCAPTIALFGATCPYMDTGSDTAVVLYHPMECSPCHRSPTCKGKFPCMGSITAKEVMETAAGLPEKK